VGTAGGTAGGSVELSVTVGCHSRGFTGGVVIVRGFRNYRPYSLYATHCRYSRTQRPKCGALNVFNRVTVTQKQNCFFFCNDNYRLSCEVTFIIRALTLSSEGLGLGLGTDGVRRPQQLYNGKCRVLSRVKECFKLRTHLRVEDQHVCMSEVECQETSFHDVAM